MLHRAETRRSTRPTTLRYTENASCLFSNFSSNVNVIKIFTVEFFLIALLFFVILFDLSRTSRVFVTMYIQVILRKFIYESMPLDLSA